MREIQLEARAFLVSGLLLGLFEQHAKYTNSAFYPVTPEGKTYKLF